MTIHHTEHEYIDGTTEVPTQRSRASRATGFIALALLVAAIIGGAFGLDRNFADQPRADSGAPAASAPLIDGPLEVSGSGVGAQAFGADAGAVVAAVTDRFGEPDLAVGPQRYVRIVGQDGWFEDAADPLSASWAYPVGSVSCWGTLCLMFGGEDADTLRLRGWELAQARRWSGFDEVPATQSPDVSLADTGIRLGDSWEQLHAAYPDTEVGGAEGATLAVDNTPWATVTDGAAGWRLSGVWDWNNPTEVPADAAVTRLSAGEGPQPGCC